LLLVLLRLCFWFFFAFSSACVAAADGRGRLFPGQRDLDTLPVIPNLPAAGEQSEEPLFAFRFSLFAFPLPGSLVLFFSQVYDVFSAISSRLAELQ
jgi:hypothetical protein